MKDKRIIVSASRRTDIPAFYMHWFMECTKKRRFQIKNPFSKKVSTLIFTPENIQAVFFWSKDYTKAVSEKHFEKLKERGFELFFHYTINSEIKDLERGITTPLETRIDTLKKLCEISGPERVFWRFDPIVFYSFQDSERELNNLGDFEKVAKKLKDSGIKRCITSFMDPYRKVEKRFKNSRMNILSPSIEKRLKVIEYMYGILNSFNISLNLCCEPDLEVKGKAENSPCIDGNLVNQILNQNTKQIKHQGMRKNCLCSKAVDIGSYEDHICRHNCIYCYAS